MTQHILLGISGSLRGASNNRKLLREAARLYGPATFTEADLRLTLYDGDLETKTGIPPAVQTLTDQIAAAEAVVISGPEYNKSISGVLKNALDWISRTKDNPWAEKPVAIMSAAAGRSGGEAAQFALRLAMLSFRPRLMAGPAMMLADAGHQFNVDGRLSNERAEQTLTRLMQLLRAEATR